jgi:hypothetical protein
MVEVVPVAAPRGKVNKENVKPVLYMKDSIWAFERVVFY